MANKTCCFVEIVVSCPLTAATFFSFFQGSFHYPASLWACSVAKESLYTLWQVHARSHKGKTGRNDLVFGDLFAMGNPRPSSAWDPVCITIWKSYFCTFIIGWLVFQFLRRKIAVSGVIHCFEIMPSWFLRQVYLCTCWFRSNFKFGWFRFWTKLCYFTSLVVFLAVCCPGTKGCLHDWSSCVQWINTVSSLCLSVKSLKNALSKNSPTIPGPLKVNLILSDRWTPGSSFIALKTCRKHQGIALSVAFTDLYLHFTSLPVSTTVAVVNSHLGY